MTGGTIEHSMIERTGRFGYPGAFVTCVPIPGSTDPVVVFKTPSVSTTLVDRIGKDEEYRSTLFIQRYVILEQTRHDRIYLGRRHLGGRHCVRRRDAGDRDRSAPARALCGQRSIGRGLEQIAVVSSRISYSRRRAI